jgi:CheY-like chemotaxis protein/HPt (histidine-containing phosphotransfer) domain-containing protein
MGGTIGLVSAPGQGSTFWFELSFVASPEEPVTSRVHRCGTSARPPSGVYANVLVAEDNAVNQLVVEGYLLEAGHRVTLVSNGREALEQVRARPFDLLVIDMQMPEMDGLVATREIRALGGPYADLPIVMLTASAMDADRERGLDAGADDYLAKPVDREALLDVVQRLASEGRSAPVAEIDDGQVADLLSALGPERLRALLGRARTSLAQQLEEVDDGSSRGDLAQIARAAHALRGATGSIGLVAASRLAQVLEDGASDAPTLARRLRALVREGLRALEDRVAAPR